MARWSNGDKRAFVSAVMQDTEQVDYRSQAQKLVQDAAIEALPPKIKAIARDKSLSQFLRSEYIHVEGWRWSFYATYTDGWRPDDDLKAQMAALSTLDKEQTKRLSDMESQLRGMVEPINTVKQAHALLPEFAKYLPSLDEPTKGGALQIQVSAVVAELSQLGWPKDAKKSKGA